MKFYGCFLDDPQEKEGIRMFQTFNEAMKCASDWCNDTWHVCEIDMTNARKYHYKICEVDNG